MVNANILISREDMQSLRYLLDYTKRFVPKDQAHVAMLEQTLERARAPSSKKSLHDVVSMNSRFCVQDLDTGKQSIYTLVLPRDSDISKGRISVLAPIGTSLLGHRIGDVTECEVPGGVKKLTIEAIISQPQRNETQSSADLERKLRHSCRLFPGSAH